MVVMESLGALRNYVEGSWTESDGNEILKILDSIQSGGIVKDDKGHYGVTGDKVKVKLGDDTYDTGVLSWSDDGKEFLVLLDHKSDHVYLGKGWSEVKEFEFIDKVWHVEKPYFLDKQKIDNLERYSSRIINIFNLSAKSFSEKLVMNFVEKVNNECVYLMMFADPDTGDYYELFSAEWTRSKETGILTLNTSEGKFEYGLDPVTILSAIDNCWFFTDEVGSTDFEEARVYKEPDPDINSEPVVGSWEWHKARTEKFKPIWSLFTEDHEMDDWFDQALHSEFKLDPEPIFKRLKEICRENNMRITRSECESVLTLLEGTGHDSMFKEPEDKCQQMRATFEERKAKKNAEKDYFANIKCPSCGSYNWSFSETVIFPESNTHVCDECGTVFVRAKFE